MDNNKEQIDWLEVKGKRADVWQYLLINKKDNKLLKCKQCNTTFKLHPTTISYKYHMTHKHKITLQQTSLNESKLPTIPSLFQKNKDKEISPAYVLARLTALNRKPFATLANSAEIKKGWKARGLKIPLTEKEIQPLVIKYADEIREHIKSDTLSNIERSVRYSLSLDEWTSKANRRYMSLNLHGNKSSVIGLGLVRLFESMPVRKAVQIINSKEFNINASRHIVAIITDGASVMKCTAHLMGIPHQACHSHGIHLGVADVLYKNNDTNLQVSMDHQECSGNAEIPEEDHSSSDSDDSCEEQDSETGVDEHFLTEMRDCFYKTTVYQHNSKNIIEAGALALGRRDCSLTKAGCVFDFLHRKLKEQISMPVGLRFYESIQKRVNERRLLKLERLLEYLEDSHLYLEKSNRGDSIQIYYTQHEIAETTKELHDRLFDVANCDEIVEEQEGLKSNEVETRFVNNLKLLNAEELQRLLHTKEKSTVSVLSAKISLLDIKREMNVFEHTKVGPTTLEKISVCDDYSLPVDFVKKRPSSFDPCLAERIPDNWASPSPLSEHVTFVDQLAFTQQPIPTSGTAIGLQTSSTPIKIVEGYSDPKDSKKVKTRRRLSRDVCSLNRSTGEKSLTKREYSKLYNSDSSAPKSSEEEEENNFNEELIKTQVPELNSPDSISEDLIKPLHSINQHKSLKRLTTSITATSEPSSLLASNQTVNPNLNTNSLFIAPSTTSSKRNPSPYYYSDLLKNRNENGETDENFVGKFGTNESKTSQDKPTIGAGKYRKSNSLDTPIPEKEEIPVPKRYSITEDGVRIIRCDSPSTTTSDDSDCTECQKRRDWHAKALALVRDSCNILPKYSPNSMPPHRFLGPAVCACAAPDFGDDHDELFRPRSIFYVHQQGADECADCTLKTVTSTTTTTTNNTNTTNYSIDNKKNNLKDDDEMSGKGSGGHGSGGSTGGRTRQIYETAFDCKILKSDDDLDDDLDRLTNHSILLQLNNSTNATVHNSKMIKTKSNQKLSSRIKNSNSNKQQANNQQTQKIIKPSKSDGSASTISQEMENMHLDNLNNANTVSSSQLPLRGYTPSPPSTAPLPVKFPAKHERYFIMNSIKSAPNLPSSQVNTNTTTQVGSPSAQHPRLRELRLPIGDGRTQGSDDGGNSIMIGNCPPLRPRSVVLETSRVLELKRSHHHKPSHQQTHGTSGRGGRKNYSSTESMATSSSGGSMESLRSSTSEGNRSSSSSESHHSTSLSSHSSDSGPSLTYPLRAPVLLHSKLHILSPISDKSSQEPGSETSDINNRNNNSQKVSPDEIISTIANTTGIIGGTINSKLNSNMEETDNSRLRKRIPQNKNLLTVKDVFKVTGDEIQGSDSGISLQSRDDSKRSSALQHLGFQKIGLSSLDKNKPDNSTPSCLPQDLNDLPFDMPKLRRRKIIPQQDACTSGSATSVDLGELPFDMPKLRRRLRLSQPSSSQPQTTTAIIHTSTESSGISQASSSQSVREDKSNLANTSFRQNLTLNLGETRAPRKFGTLEFGTSRGLNLNVGSTSQIGVDLIDAAIPLDRQGWYHGAISRIEAENTLRPLSEGSFLVRNSESTRQDYSLSLKSAKGFMHMRIQQSTETGQYILGQFSRPFETIPEMIRHFCLNRLPVRGAEHMCLLEPVVAQLL